MSHGITGNTDRFLDEIASVARLLDVSIEQGFDVLPDYGNEKGPRVESQALGSRLGLEPRTYRLTADCSAN